MKREYFFLIITISLLLFSSCSRIEGDINDNQRPTVEFVNDNPDAEQVAADYEIVNFRWEVAEPLDSTFFNTPVSGETYEYELISYESLAVLDTTVTIYYFPFPGDSVQWDNVEYVPESAYSFDVNTHRIVTLTHTDDFTWLLGQTYRIDCWVHYEPLFSFAPIISWYGSDPDGFVEAYEYYDQPLVGDAVPDPNDIDEGDWIRTQNTFALINLTTELGQITPHAVWLRAVDNSDAYSDLVSRVFNRSNQAPHTPEIQWAKGGWCSNSSQTNPYTGFEEAAYYSQSIIVRDQFIAEEENTRWSGVTFYVQGSDPDDQVLYKIPLQYSYRLFQIDTSVVDEMLDVGLMTEPDSATWADYFEEVPMDEDVVVDWEEYTFLDDHWTGTTYIALKNLESGAYQLNIHVRDDGYEEALEPAWVRFQVQAMQFDKDVLVLNQTRFENGPYDAVFTQAELDDYYYSLISENLADVGVDTSDGNVSYLSIGNQSVRENVPHDLLTHYRKVMWINDDYGPENNQDEYNFLTACLLSEYMDMGGRVLMSGWRNQVNTWGQNNMVGVVPFLFSFNYTGGSFFQQYFGVSSVYLQPVTLGANPTTPIDALIGVQPEFEDPNFGSLDMDGNKLQQILDSNPPARFIAYADVSSGDTLLGLKETEVLALEDFATSLYTFDSFTAHLPDTMTVHYRPDNLSQIGTGLYPEWSEEPDSIGCWIWPNAILDRYKEITQIHSIVNITRRHQGLPADTAEFRTIAWSDDHTKHMLRVSHVNLGFDSTAVSYWQSSDTVMVHVSYEPTLYSHEKPVVAFYEDISFGGGGFGGASVNFNSIYSGLPLFFLDNSEGDIDMLMQLYYYLLSQEYNF